MRANSVKGPHEFSVLSSRVVHGALVVELKVNNVCSFYVLSVNVEEVSEPRPEEHVKFVEIEVKDGDLVFVEQPLVVVVDHCH